MLRSSLPFSPSDKLKHKSEKLRERVPCAETWPLGKCLLHPCQEPLTISQPNNAAQEPGTQEIPLEGRQICCHQSQHKALICLNQELCPSSLGRADTCTVLRFSKNQLHKRSYHRSPVSDSGAKVGSERALRNSS